MRHCAPPLPLRLFFAAFCSAIAVSLPFFPPYLRGLGLSGRQIGLVMAISPLMNLGVPVVWGWMADRTRRPDWLLRFACLGAGAFFLPLAFVRQTPALYLLVAGHQLFAVSIIGLADSLAIDRLKAGEDYGRIRVWGSISFALVCPAVGAWLAARGARDGDVLVPVLATAGYALGFLAALALRGHGGRAPPRLADLRELLRDRRLLFLLVLAPIHWMALAPYHAFLGILLQDRGQSANVVAAAYLIAVAGEIAALYYFSRLRAAFSLSGLFAFTAAVSMLRWWFTAWAPSPMAIVLAQLAHAVTFGIYWSAAIHWIAACVPPHLRATGQTMFTTASFGVGSLVGTLGAGAIYDATGGAAAAFAVAGCVEFAALGLIALWGRRLEPSAESLRAASGSRA